jgi:subtilisin family serine protease
MKLHILATRLSAILVAWLVSSATASAGSPSQGPNGKAIPPGGNPAGQEVPGVPFGKGRASARGVLAKLKNPANQNAAALVAAMDRRNLKVDRTFGLVPGLQRLVLKPGAAVQNLDGGSIAETIQELQKTGLYEYVEPDWILQIQAIPSDAAFTDGSLWGLRNTGQSGGTSGADIRAVNAWDITTGSTGVVVAVIDTGIRYTHQDLAANMWRNPGESGGGKETNGIDDDGNGYIDDVHGINSITGSGNPMDDNDHGSHCAGTIGAVANDGGAHVGVAWNVRLMGLKFIASDGYGDTSDAITCIDYAVARGAKVLSNSWGLYDYSQGLHDSIATARDAGVLFVAAAGNDSNNNDSTAFYPASYDLANVVAVAALDRSDQRAGFSNYGPNTVDLGAPGVGIYSCASASDFSYKIFDGTSMAAPHVAGAAVLLAAARPNANYIELKQRLLNAARPVSSLTGISVTGGALNAHASLTLVDSFANGSFEQGHNFWTTQGNLTYSPPGVISGTDGSRCTVFNNAQRPPNGVITQSFVTVVGETYTLTFKVGVLAYNTLQQRLRVNVESAGGATLVDNTTTVVGGGGGSTLWTDRQFQFTATSNVTVLRFTDVSTVTDSLDLLLDNVRVTGQQQWSLTVNSTVNGEFPLPGDVSVSVSPPDLNGQGGGDASFQRQYLNGQSVSLLALGGVSPLEYWQFSHWLKDGVLVSYQEATTLVMTADTTMTAVFNLDSGPYITSPSNAVAVQNSPFEYRITAGGYPESFWTSDLPPGLSSVGSLISGTPTVPGVYPVQLGAMPLGKKFEKL